MKLLVCGGRNFNDWNLLSETLTKQFLRKHIDMLIHGGAPGADSLADAWAEGLGIQIAVCRAHWARYGASAGPRRNRAMLALKPDLVVAFPGGTGTANMVQFARDAGIPVETVVAMARSAQAECR